jgi:glucokinase
MTGETALIGAIDVGGTKIAVGLVNIAGQVVARSEAPSTGLMSYATAVAYLSSELGRLARAHSATLKGIGIGLTGRIDRRSGLLTENEFLPDWGRHDLTGDLSRMLGVEAAIENDADAAALGEARWGAGQGCGVFLYVTVSTGIGGGLVVDGKVYRGSAGWHPEIGHMVISDKPTTCYCGASGCWEQLACGPALAAWYHAQGGQALTTAEICALARLGEPLAVRTIAHGGDWMGRGLANLINLFAPERIALGGGVMRSWDLFEPHARAVIETACSFMVPHALTEIVTARLGDDAPLAGAAAVWLQEVV